MMKRLASLLVVVFVGSFLVPAADEAPWIWAGLEILGNHKVPRAEIEKMITIPIGGEYHRGDAPFWTESCAEVQKKFDFAAVKCGDRPLRVFDGRKAYLIVDIVERGHEDLLKFGEAPSGSVPFANDEMVRISGELSAKTMAGAMAGQYYNESAKQGYVHGPNGQERGPDPAGAALGSARSATPRQRTGGATWRERSEEASRSCDPAELGRRRSSQDARTVTSVLERPGRGRPE